ncbi:integrase core domain-containing protein [Actinoplanes sp. NPDC049599]|uniref:integrase core domain-containing protein n=1 Tax=Actinoplanes sp. NPDC049599 TaxID=3363903 RepID=UPI0037942240
MVFTTRLSGGSLRGSRGRNGLEQDLHRLKATQKNSRPNHPSTCGKVERFQQTPDKWLRGQPTQPTDIAQLQALIDAFVDEYNHRRPHRSLPRHATPATAYQARPKSRTRRSNRSRNTPTTTPRPHRPSRENHPALRRAALLHRRRTNPHRNPRPRPRSGPQHPDHRRRCRRTPPRTRPRPHQALPAHRPTPRTHTEKEEPLNPQPWVQGFPMS